MDNQHIIGKQIFNIRLKSQSGAFDVQHRLAGCFWDKIVPRLEMLFDDYAGPEQTIRIDKLEIDLGDISEQELETELVAAIYKRLQEELKFRSSSFSREKTTVVSRQANLFQTWLFFLEYGFLPWNAGVDLRMEELLKSAFERIAGQRTSLQALRQLIRRKPAAMSRLVLQYSDKDLAVLLEAVSGKRRTIWEPLLGLISSLLLTEAGKTFLRTLARQQPRSPFSEAAGIHQPKDLRIFFWTFLFDVFLLKQERPSWTEAGRALIRVFTGVTKADFPELLRTAAVTWSLSLSAEVRVLIMEWQHILGSGNTPPGVSKIKPAKSHRTPEDQMDRLSEERLRAEEEERIHPTEEKNMAVEDPTEDRISQEEKMDREHSSANGQVQEPAAHFPSDTSETSPEGSEGEIHAEVGSGPSSGEDLPISHSKPGLAEKTPDSGPDEHGDADASGHREEVLSDPSDRWRSYIRDYRAGKLSASSSEKSRSSLFTKTADEMIADQAVYIRCAGVVLLHPYLAHYFGKIGLVEKGDFIDEAAREKAVCLIHYLASGQTNLPEYELLLPKLLCGFPLEDPLERELVLQEAELEEGERMMQAAIDHWGVIGQASPDGLREGFLQRDGKLENKPQGWVLTVERKTIDILLNRLPFGWSISVVRLPWMKDLLKVNWI